MAVRRALSMLTFVGAMVVASVAFVSAPASAGGGVPPCEKPVSQAAGSEVQIDLSCFTPTVVDVTVGRTVRFVNTSVMPHTVTGVGGSFGDTTLLNKGATLDATFDKVGVFPYYCVLHPGMTGSVVVSAAGTSPAAATPLATDRQAETQAGAPATAINAPPTPRAEPEGQALSASAASPPLAGGADATIVVLLLAQLGLTILIGFTLLWNRIDRA
ncbi:MAG TPA: plastocyanin/azurin family copper-binding protein [Acidimicrobiales bacterium]|nr:plastocyanin/azurin family copper-binding protein [Acidimicrobiales bacterium]